MPDRRNENELIKKIKKRSEAYTPEWRFDEKNPDAGTALGLIFSEQHMDTMKKFHQLQRKNMLEFFRHAGTDLKPAKPAEGYVSFGLVNHEVAGTEVRKETGLLADVNGGEESIIFETVNDVYVTPADVCDIVQVLPEEDAIYSVYERNMQEEKEPDVFWLFGKTGMDLQEHTLYLAHEHIFYVEKEGSIALRFELTGRASVSDQLIRKLADTSCIKYEYFSENGYVPFDGAEADGSGVRLYKGKNQPLPVKAVYAEKNAYWIRMRCLDISVMKHLAFNGVYLSVECPKLYPDIIFAGGIEQQSRQYLAFGEQMGLYETVYFSSAQALQQPGAKITLSFRLNFMKIPSETYGQGNQVDWKLIMKRTDFIPDPEYDIDIDEVIWEYFNGYDWRKLPESDRYAKVFTPEHGLIGQRVEVSFHCPLDLKPILVQSVDAYYIRARITKMRNLYRWNGKYIPPMLGDTAFSYEYRDPFPVPAQLVSCNNMDTHIFKQNDLLAKKQTINPYTALMEKKPTLYMGFDKPLDKGPIRIWIELLGCEEPIESPVEFECFCKGKWKSLNIIDGTEGFRKTGILTLLGNAGITKENLWGKERFWLRVTAENADEKNWPKISSIHMNVTEIRAVETKVPEYFLIEANEKNKEIRLTSGNVYEAQVWVKEYHELTDSQIEELKEQYEVAVYPAGNGVSREIWVCWKEVLHFSSSGAADCHYKIDKIHGVIYFSDGVHGRIPDAGAEETIRVEYKCGGGANTNVPIGAVRRLNGTVGFINQVSNIKATAGGADKEDADHAIWRMGQSFRHRGRAVTAGDYEALALEADNSIAVVKCYPNYNEAGKKCRGHVALVLLLENHAQSREYFFTIKNRCMEYLKSRSCAGLIESGRLHIIEPQFIELSVSAGVLVKDMNSIMETRHECLHFLNTFLDPLVGNFDGRGWKIGSLPNQIQLQNALRSVPGVLRVESLGISAVTWKNGKRVEIDLDEIADKKFAIAVNGVHEIDILIGGGGH